MASPLWGDVEKISDFQERKIRSHGTFFGKYFHMVFFSSPLGGDVEKISDFQSRKIRSHGSNLIGRKGH